MQEREQGCDRKYPKIPKQLPSHGMGLGLALGCAVGPVLWFLCVVGTVKLAQWMGWL